MLKVRKRLTLHIFYNLGYQLQNVLLNLLLRIIVLYKRNRLIRKQDKTNIEGIKGRGGDTKVRYHHLEVNYLIVPELSYM